jgi:hypothetical protein
MGSSGGSTSTPRSDDCSRCSQRTSHCSPNQVNAHTTELLDSGRSSAKRIALTSQTGIRPASSLLLPPHLFLSLSVPQLHTYCSIHLISIPCTRHAPLNPRFCSSPHLQFVPSFSLPQSLANLLPALASSLNKRQATTDASYLPSIAGNITTSCFTPCTPFMSALTAWFVSPSPFPVMELTYG